MDTFEASARGSEAACSVGVVATRYATVAEPPDPLVLTSGRTLGPITIAYETYGTLSPEGDNAILLVHALSGDAHAAGWHAEQLGRDGAPLPRAKPGWWDVMVGPGKAFDTEKYFVISSNVLGGCMGTTGPNSIDPCSGERWGLRFPVITVRDMTNVQKLLLDALGVRRLLSVAGGSMGGMGVLDWTIAYPEMVRSALPIATTARLSAQAIAFNEVGRQAILSDPDFAGGDYYDGPGPDRGLALARMVGHITYLSDQSMRAKFGRRLRSESPAPAKADEGSPPRDAPVPTEANGYAFGFSTEFEVESYLAYQGATFVERFDANTYLYMTRAMDYFDLTNGHPSLAAAFAGAEAKYLVISFSSDWLFPTYQSKEIVRALRANDVNVAFTELKSPYGHDAFLLEAEEQTELIRDFLAHAAMGDGHVSAI